VLLWQIGNERNGATDAPSIGGAALSALPLRFIDEKQCEYRQT